MQSTVLTTNNTRQYKIDEVDFKHNPETYSFTQNGKKINMIQYFRQSYNIELKDKKQPLLLEFKDGGRTIALPPEICVMNGLPDHLLNDFRAQQEMSHYKHLPPAEKLGGIDQLRDDFMKKDSEFTKWGVEIADGEELKTKVLEAPTITGGKN